MTHSFIFSSESVSEGHPDKVCDFIADSILDAHLEQDPRSHVACEVLCKSDQVVLAGEITSSARVDVEQVARDAIGEIGYAEGVFQPETVTVHNFIGAQSEHIRRGVDREEMGAGDQGLVFGFATNETKELMPLPVTLAHRITRALAAARKSGHADWLRPDSKAQVSVRYEDGRPQALEAVVVSTQHATGFPQEEIRSFVAGNLLPECLGSWWSDDVPLHVNPTGEFAIGGPEGDCGVTGRKIIVDTYGGYARHGGGAFSGKDATKVDRSAAYFARFVAREIVKHRIADCAEIQVAYAIGVAQPVSIHIDTRGTGDAALAAQFAHKFDYRPAAIIEQLDLRRPDFRSTTNYGHFGKPHLRWEQ